MLTVPFLFLGSGKTTFIKAFMDALPENQKGLWEAHNQDALGSRKAVIQQVEYSLNRRKCVIVDRVNFDQQQRAHWINISHAFFGELII